MQEHGRWCVGAHTQAFTFASQDHGRLSIVHFNHHEARAGIGALVDSALEAWAFSDARRTEPRPEDGGGATGSGDVTVIAQRQAPAGQGVEANGTAINAVQAWLRGECW